MVPEDLQELLEGFVAESIDNLDDNEIRIGRLDAENNAEDLKALFRVFHTLKGLAGFFELNALREVTHAAENLLDIFRSDPKPLDQDTIDFLYGVFDFLHDSIAYVGEALSDEDLRPKAELMLEQIRIQISKYDNEETINSKESSAKTKSAGNEPKKAKSEQRIDQESGEDSAETQKPGKEIKSEIAESEPTPSTPTDKNDITDGKKIAASKLSDILKDVDVLKRKITDGDADKASAGKIVDKLKDALESGSLEDNREMVDIIESVKMIFESVAEGVIDLDETINAIIESDLQILGSFVDSVFESISDDQTESADDTPAEANMEQTAPAISEDKTLETQKTGTMYKPAPKAEDSTKISAPKVRRKDIRVSADKLNRLFDLVGEIITMETMVIYNKDIEDMDLPNFSQSANMLEKLTRELQSITMSIRMIPLEGLFNKMSRMVRDISRKFGKEINLEIFGQETEMDKNVIDELSDPMVHLIRNSIDHGIEPPEERSAAGKPEKGKIELGAELKGNEIHIYIKDDGRGLDREKILQKALERGVVSPEETLPDSKVWQLIFEPGLSTAEKVTDISGRGVGMDVVRKNIEKLRGAIEIESSKGKGTTIIFRIPLTLAILDAMIVRVGANKYAAPILSIQESFRPKPEDLSKTPDGVDMVRVRKDIYPVIRLHEIMKTEPDYKDLDQGILLLLNSNDKKICLFADEIIGQQQAVVKPLSDFVGEIRGVTGCMVMADGKIGLILDPEGIIQKAEELAD